jgi:hypothetical protein
MRSLFLGTRYGSDLYCRMYYTNAMHFKLAIYILNVQHVNVILFAAVCNTGEKINSRGLQRPLIPVAQPILNKQD